MSTTLVSGQVAPGAMAAVGSHFHPADLNMARALGQRFALAIRLSVLGAWHASGESDTHYREDDRVVVYTSAETEAAAREEYEEWGTIVEVAPLFNVPEPTPRASDDLCHGCYRPGSDVGPLGDYVVHARVSDVIVRYCGACAEAHGRTDRAITAIREFRRQGAR